MGVVVARRVILALLVLVGISVAGWFWGLPRYRPEISDSQLFAVLVSQEQGEIAWPNVLAANVGFAYVTATEGSDRADARFESNWDNARAAGLRVGAYHVFSHCVPGADQAGLFLAVAPPDAASLPPALGVEQSGACGDSASPDQVVQQVQAFLDGVEQAHGRPAVLHVDGLDYLEDSMIRRRAWRRSLFRGPVQSDWSLWQFHDRAAVAGIDGAVDLSIANSEQLVG